MYNITIGVLTMNAGKDIPGSILDWNLRNDFSSFNRVIVVDGRLTTEAKEYYKQFENVEVIDSPWRDGKEDCYVHQYRQFINSLEHNEWALYLDDDEGLSNDLGHFLGHYDGEYFFDWEEYKNVTMIKLPCVLYLTEDGKRYYPAEPPPKKEYTGQWTKSILFKKTKGLNLTYFGSHVLISNNDGEIKYDWAPYIHCKSLESFVYNDVWQAFLHPGGQQYTAQEAAIFKMLTQCYKTTKEFKEATKKGTWSPPLKRFAWEHRKIVERPISRLAWVYYILEGNKMPENDEFMEWENIKQYVLSPETMKLYNENKKNKTGEIIITNE